MCGDNRLAREPEESPCEAALKVRMQEDVGLVKNDHVTPAMSPEVEHGLQPDLDTVTSPPDLSLVSRALFGVEQVEAVVYVSNDAVQLQPFNLWRPLEQE